MTKSDLIALLVRTGHSMPRDQIVTAVDSFFEAISVALERGDRVELRGFGTLHVRVRRPRKARNPRTGETVTIAHKCIPWFHASEKMHARLNTFGRVGDG